MQAINTCCFGLNPVHVVPKRFPAIASCEIIPSHEAIATWND